MERLTHRYIGGMAWASIFNVVARGETECTGPVIDRLAAYEDTMPLERAQELAQAEKDGRPPVTPGAKTYDAHTAEAEYLLGVLWNGLHNADGMDAKAADRVAEIAHEKDRVQSATTPTTPRNDPLTRKELMELDGEPVWIEYIPSPGEECAGLWALVSIDKEYDEIYLLNSIGGSSSYDEAWEDIRAIYRRKPEGNV